MEIEIRLYLGLNRYLPPGGGGYARRIEVPDGATVAEVAAGLGLPEVESLVFMINGAPAGLDDTLEPGDALTGLPPAGGG